MWILYAFGSAFFAGVTSILAKCGIKNTDSNVATAVRTIIVFVFSWVIVFVVGSQGMLTSISEKTLIFLILSGLSTGVSWLFYFHALQLGDINKVTPIDKSSVILTMILAFLFLGEAISLLKILSMILIGTGTMLMIQKTKEVKPNEAKLKEIESKGAEAKELEANKAESMHEKKETIFGIEELAHKTENRKSYLWFLYAVLSAIFASLTSILGKVGIEGVESNLGTAIRTGIVLIMAWIVVLVSGKLNTIKDISLTSWFFLILSGFATGASWLCYYRALQTGPASVVVPIDKLSIVVTVTFSFFVFHEKLSRKALLGFVMIIVGTLLLVY